MEDLTVLGRLHLHPSLMVARVVRLLPLIEMVEMVVLVGAVALPLIIKAALIIDPVVGVDIPVVEAVVITVATQIMVEAVVV